jgi:starch phosphorylase
MAQLTPRFSANSTVREYVEKYYMAAAIAYRKRAAHHGALGRQLLRWQAALAQHWGSIHFGHLQVETSADQHLFQLQVYLNDLDPDAVQVELYADPLDGNMPERQVMIRGHQLVGAVHGYVYSAQVPTSRPASDYTPRLIPYHPDAIIPLEAAQILWQR